MEENITQQNKNTNKKGKRVEIFFVVLILIYLAVTIPLFCLVDAFTVHWFIFGLAFILIPFGVLNFFAWGASKTQLTSGQMILATKRICVLTSYLWLLDAFYMCIFNNWTVAIWGVGTTIVIINSIGLINNFLGKVKILKQFIPFDLIITIGIGIYLIYIIPNAQLQQIITTVASAFLGGALTLVGVAWTIRHNAEERELAEKKRDEEMKLEEKKKYRPVFNVYRSAKLPDKYVGVSCDEFIGVDRLIYVGNEDKFDSCLFEITNFLIENTDFTAFYLRGIKINSKFYERSANLFVKKDAYLYCCFNNHKLNLKEQLQNIDIVVEDLLGNIYDVSLGFNVKTENNLSVVTITGSRRIKLDKGSN